MRMASFLFFIFSALSGCGLLPKQTPGAAYLNISKVWVRTTLEKTDLTFRKTNRMAPLITSNMIIQGNASDGIEAVRKSDAGLIWRINIDGGVEGGAEVIKDRLFFGGNDNYFYSVELSTGKILWKVPIKSESLSAPTLVEGVIYVLAGNNVVFALDATTGQQIWLYSRVESQNFSIRGGSKPIFRNGNLYVGFSDGYLVSLNAKSGALKWEKQLNKNKKFRDIDSSVVFDDENLFVTGYDSNIYCLNAESGEINWKEAPGGYGSVMLAKDFLYYSGSNGEVIAMNRKTGKHVWSYKLKNGIGTEPVFYNNLVVIGESLGRLYFFKYSTGEVLGSFEPGMGIFSKVAIDEKLGDVFFISNEANLYKLHVTTKYKNEGIPWLN